MLLQTNSYIVPKERRAEHARLIRRFRQALARIGCDQFEVYEQVGANWSPGGANGRYVQIMRFRDRQHQQAVQAAEANDHGAQQIIAEFCDLINFPYQQQHGYFATGFYTSVLPTGPRHAGDDDTHDAGEGPDGEHGPATANPFVTAGGPQDIEPDINASESDAEPAGFSQEFEAAADAASAPKEPVSHREHAGEPGDLAEHVVSDGGGGSSLGSFLDSLNDADLPNDVADTGQRGRFQEPHLGNPDPSFADVPIPVEPISPVHGDAHAGDPAVPSNGKPESPDAASSTRADWESPAASFEPLPDAEATDLSPGESSILDDAPGRHGDRNEPSIDEVAIDHGLLFEDELPVEIVSPLDSHAAASQSFGMDETAAPGLGTHPSTVDVAHTRAPTHDEPHEELLPLIPDLYQPDHGRLDNSAALSDEAGLDALLDDANLLDNVPFPGALEDPPRLHSRRDPVGTNGHGASAEKDTDLLEFEALIRDLEDPSADHGRLAQ